MHAAARVCRRGRERCTVGGGSRRERGGRRLDREGELVVRADREERVDRRARRDLTAHRADWHDDRDRTVLPRRARAQREVCLEREVRRRAALGCEHRAPGVRLREVGARFEDAQLRHAREALRRRHDDADAHLEHRVRPFSDARVLGAGDGQAHRHARHGRVVPGGRTDHSDRRGIEVSHRRAHRVELASQRCAFGIEQAALALHLLNLHRVLLKVRLVGCRSQQQHEQPP